MDKPEAAVAEREDVDLADLFPSSASPEGHLTVSGRPIHVRPMSLRQIGAASRLIKDFAEQHSGVSIQELLAYHDEAAAELISIAVGVEKDWVRDLPGDELVPLAMSVLRVNADFFIRQLGPLVAAWRPMLATGLSGGGATTPSPSTEPASPIQAH